MSERFALYYAPALSSALWQAATAWLNRPELHAITQAARRYGFHATLKAPMRLRRGMTRGDLEGGLALFAREQPPVEIGWLRPSSIEGFLALTPVAPTAALTDFAREVVETFEPLRAPPDPAETARRLAAPLTPRQIDLVGRYGYPYVLEEFRFHMTLTDRLEAERQTALLAEANEWLAAALAQPLTLDRLVLFRQPHAGAPFERLDDYLLEGQAR